MPESDKAPDILPQRLCSEVQLFDLCDLETCTYKADRFCSDPVLLRRFEKIADDERRFQDRYDLDQADNAEFDGDGYDGESDGLDGDYCDDEDADWQDEE